MKSTHSRMVRYSPSISIHNLGFRPRGLDRAFLSRSRSCAVVLISFIANRHQDSYRYHLDTFLGLVLVLFLVFVVPLDCRMQRGNLGVL